MEKLPYQLMIGWRKGALVGAQIEWSELMSDGKEVPLPAEEIDIGQGKGFPLAAILDQVLIDALLKIKEHEATISAKEKENTVALAAKDAELAKKVAELAAKTEEHAAEKAARKAKGQEAAALAAQVAAKDAELTVLKMPAEEKRKAGIRGEIERLQKELE